LTDTPRPPPTPKDLPLDQGVSGKFLITDALPEDAGFVQAYRMTGKKGQRIVVSASLAEPLDATKAGRENPVPNFGGIAVELRKAADTPFTVPPLFSSRPISKRPARFVGILNEDGEYILNVIQTNSKDPLPYQVTANLYNIVYRQPSPIEIGKIANDAITYTDDLLKAESVSGGLLFHDWVLAGKNGQSVQVDICSIKKEDDFFVQILGDTVLGKKVIEIYDDTSPNPPCNNILNPQFILRFQRQGSLDIRVAVRDGGSYTIATKIIP